jgi:hypothetical protein
MSRWRGAIYKQFDGIRLFEILKMAKLVKRLITPGALLANR